MRIALNLNTQEKIQKLRKSYQFIKNFFPYFVLSDFIFKYLSNDASKFLSNYPPFVYLPRNFPSPLDKISLVVPEEKI